MKGITAYQFEILKHLRQHEEATGQLIDFDQLLDRLSWTPSKESAQFSIRAMIKKKLLCKEGLQSRRGRNRVCYRILDEGKLFLDPRKPECKVEDENIDIVPGCDVSIEIEE